MAGACDILIAGNARAAFEVPDDMSITEDSRAVYPPKARREIAAHSPKLAEGFRVDDLVQAYADMMELRGKLKG
ncbi:MAG TPA: hypothetical protein QGG32_12020 [Rhodospirillales bacterium]|nr:hypothetical protein [Rhodospirillales bacterium]